MGHFSSIKTYEDKRDTVWDTVNINNVSDSYMFKASFAHLFPKPLNIISDALEVEDWGLNN